MRYCRLAPKLFSSCLRCISTTVPTSSYTTQQSPFVNASSTQQSLKSTFALLPSLQSCSLLSKNIIPMQNNYKQFSSRAVVPPHIEVPALGLVQEHPLLISSIIEFAAKYHGKQEIVSRSIEGPIHRYNYSQAHHRTRKLANALKNQLGVVPGDRVGTLAWNGYRHFELYYAISGMGAITHTINPRLFEEQLVFIINHAEDNYIFVDLTFVPVLEKIANKIKSVKGFIIMTDEEHMPDCNLPNVHCYETLLNKEEADFVWPTFDERAASGLCYTSGTTGNPKGVLYSHRSNVLHCLVTAGIDCLSISSHETILPVVPLFHVNAWGYPFSAPMTGAKLVFPGAALDGKSIYELIDTEAVTQAAGVPTVWLMLLKYLAASGNTLDGLHKTIIGGSAAPPSMIETFEKKYNVDVIHAWGMTEMSPVGTSGTLTKKQKEMPEHEQLALKAKQGRPAFLCDIKIEDAKGQHVPHDGKTFGNIFVKGNWIASSYFKQNESPLVQGWFPTGDVGTFDEHNFMEITDRTKDVIKSGGEWISSIQLENVAMGHPAVSEAVAIGVEHDKWDERPLLVVVLQDQASTLTKDELLAFMSQKLAKWMIPDDVVFVDEVPHTATGKVMKKDVREMFKNYKWPA